MSGAPIPKSLHEFQLACKIIRLGSKRFFLAKKDLGISKMASNFGISTSLSLLDENLMLAYGAWAKLRWDWRDYKKAAKLFSRASEFTWKEADRGALAVFASDMLMLRKTMEA